MRLSPCWPARRGRSAASATFPRSLAYASPPLLGRPLGHHGSFLTALQACVSSSATFTHLASASAARPGIFASRLLHGLDALILDSCLAGVLPGYGLDPTLTVGESLRFAEVTARAKEAIVRDRLLIGTFPFLSVLLGGAPRFRLWDLLQQINTSIGGSEKFLLPARIRLLERKVDTIRHLIDTWTARVNSLLGHYSLHRAADTLVPCGSSATSSADVASRDPALLEVLQYKTFAASAARVSAVARDDPFKINVVAAALKEIRLGGGGSIFFLKTLLSKIPANHPICKLLRSVSGEVLTEYLGRMLASNYSGHAVEPAFVFRPPSTLLPSMRRGHLELLFSTWRSNLLFSIERTHHPSATKLSDEFASEHDISRCVGICPNRARLQP